MCQNLKKDVHPCFFSHRSLGREYKTKLAIYQSPQRMLIPIFSPILTLGGDSRPNSHLTLGLVASHRCPWDTTACGTMDPTMNPQFQAVPRSSLCISQFQLVPSEVGERCCVPAWHCCSQGINMARDSERKRRGVCYCVYL